MKKDERRAKLWQEQIIITIIIFSSFILAVLIDSPGYPNALVFSCDFALALYIVVSSVNYLTRLKDRKNESDPNRAKETGKTDIF